MSASVRFLVSVISLGNDAPVNSIARAVAELGHVPLDLEATGIVDVDQWESAQRHIERSDYLVIAVGDPSSADTSKVQRTFNSAVERDVPVLVLLSANGDPAAGDKDWSELVTKLIANPFGMSVNTTKTNTSVAGAIGRMIDTYARPGFVPTTDMPSKNVAEQLAALVNENESLRARLGQGGDQTVARQRRETVVHMLQQNKILIPLWYRGATSWGDPMEMTLYDFFLRMGPELASDVSTAAAAEFIPVGVCGLDREDFRVRWPVPSNNLNLWFTDLMAIGVVKPSNRKRRGKDEGQYWTLTSEGRDLLSDIRRSVLLGGGHRHVGFTTEFPIVPNMGADL